MFEVNNLTCGYDEKIIIKDIGFHIHKGEFIGIIGPNGSGKTTLFRALTGVLPLEYGEVKIAGCPLSDYQRRDLAKIIAVVPQTTDVGFSFLVEDIVMMGRMPHLGGWKWETSQDVQIAKEMMALTDTEHLAQRYINELSGGEAQRVIIARALTQQPQAILLDEPTAFLDINHQVEIYDILKKLNVEEHLTILTISHDLNLAALYCDRLILLKEGQIFMTGSPKEVLTAKNLKDVYESEVIIDTHPLSDCPRIVVKSQYYEQAVARSPLKIHLIGGGGSIVNLLRKLYIMGHKLSCGVLNVSDSDYEMANSLGITVVEEKPFSPIENVNHQRNLELIKSAEAVILGGVAYGPGNLLNLEAALEAVKMGKPTYLMQSKQDNDFVGGKATKLINEIVQQGGVEIKNQAELFPYLDRLNKKNAS